MIEAVCAIPGVLAVGAGIDVAAANPDLAQCVLTSIVKDVVSAVRETMYAFAQGETQRTVSYGLTDGRVSVMRPTVSGLPVDTAERYREAETGILTGQIDTCPGDCGAPLGSVVEDGGGLEDDGSGEDEGVAGDAQG
jgi:basic membrane lipoprotein Med (substrate-binding protein (PBP1-ABC) superfamily)